MEWTEITVEIHKKDLEKAVSISHMISDYGVYIEDYSNLKEDVSEIANVDLIDDELLSKDPEKSIVHVYISPEENPTESVQFLKERLNCENADYKIKTDICKEEDWADNWKKYFKPTKVGDKLLICPIWESQLDPAGRTVLKIEPGMAFGTGTHETTRLCLEMIEKYLKKGDTVLDIGCGSGILSTASILLGAEHAVGTDIDKLAVKISKENAKINNIESKFESVCGNLTQNVHGKFDIIISNIVADVIIKLSENTDEFMHQESVYIMSGIIDTRLNDVKKALSGKFTVLNEKSENGWCAVAAKLKSPYHIKGGI